MPLIAVGSKFPSFTLADQSGKPVSFNSLLGVPLVLYAYPKADTSSCTKQACGFNEALPQLAKLGARIVGLSPDEPKDLAKFAAKYKLDFPLLADPAKKGETPATLDALGVWGEKSMYGSTYMGIIRTTYILDAKGVVTHRFDAVKVPGHAAAVLTALGASPARKAASKKPGAEGVKKVAKKAAKKNPKAR